MSTRNSKNSLIKSYLARCRICFKNFESNEKYIHITSLIRERFLAITHIELKDSCEEYSNIICETCDTELRNVQSWRREIIHKQRKLIKLIEDGIEVPIKVEKESADSEESEGISEDEELSDIDFNDDDGEEERYKKFNITKYFCDVCGKKTLLKSNFESHMKSHSKKEILIKSEPETQQVVKRRDMQAKQRVIKTYAKKPEVDINLKTYNCPCGMNFTQHSEFVAHTRSVHENLNKGHQCQQCERSYYAKKDLNSHVRRVHLKTDGPLFCEICAKEYASRGSLKVHLQTHGEPQFICPYNDCKKAFYRKEKLDLHEKKHRGQKDFMCHICDKAFFLRPQLKQHIAIAHENFRVYCLIEGCNFSVGRKDYLRFHLLTNHRELEGEILDDYLKRVREMKVPY